MLLDNGVLLGTEFTPDRKTLLTADQNGPVHVWDTASGRRRFLFRNALSLHNSAATVSPDGRLLATAYFGNWPRIWSLATGKLLPMG